VNPDNIGAFHASGVVNLVLSKAAYFYFGGGHFHFSEKAVPSFGQDPSVKNGTLAGFGAVEGRRRHVLRI
jgi:hypothetical protein